MKSWLAFQLALHRVTYNNIFPINWVVCVLIKILQQNDTKHTSLHRTNPKTNNFIASIYLGMYVRHMYSLYTVPNPNNVQLPASQYNANKFVYYGNLKEALRKSSESAEQTWNY